MATIIQAACWLERDQEAADWQKEYDDFFQTFQRAARRDMRPEPSGNNYQPSRMQPDPGVYPQKVQWAFLHAVFPGKIFGPEDALVRGNMAMLQAAESEGLVSDTGWRFV